MDSLEQKASESWTAVVTASPKWWNINLTELWSFRDLILLFVKRDFVATYKQTIFGPLWHLIRPIITTLTFTFIFGRIVGLSTDGVPPILFYLCGIVCWGYFADCLTKTSDTFVANSNIFGKVYFPRLVMPIATIISSFVTFSIQLLMFLAVWTYYFFTTDSVQPGATIFLIPVLLVIMALLGLGSGIIISSLTTKYRDFRFLVTFGIQLLMYASPVIYPLSSVSGNLKTILMANPISAIIETFKYAFLGVGSFDPMHLLYSAVFAIIIFTAGILTFSKVEKTFMDTV